LAGGPVIRVLSVASECAPLVKTGGLADVVGALPTALASENIETRLLLPGYPSVMESVAQGETIYEDPGLFGGPARIVAARASGLDLILIDAPHLYARQGNIYLGPDGRDWPDNPERFAALSWVAARIGAEGAGTWQPHVIHAHDWQGGLVPEYLHYTGNPKRVRTVLTVHNIAFHGLADPQRIGALRLSRNRYTREGFEFWGRISTLKAGLVGADRLTTVSPTYATELMRDEFGMGFDGVMRQRRAVLSGILNGIDEATWNPTIDTCIPSPYEGPQGKEVNTHALRNELGLPPASGPLCVVVSRLTEQKGLDLLLECLPSLLARGGQLAVLGSGERWMEDAFRNAARDDNVAVRIGYDEALAHRLIAGGDAIIVPSRFEPCGLTQLYGLRYGTIPIVALTGGLADTVINASPAGLAAGVATGIQFHPITSDALHDALDRLCDLHADRETWHCMQINAMHQPVGWAQSARAYAALFRDLVPAT
jgi:starch synthase